MLDTRLLNRSTEARMGLCRQRPSSAPLIHRGPVASAANTLACRPARATATVTLVPNKPKLSYVGVTRAADGLSPSKWALTEKLDTPPPPPALSQPDTHFQQMGVEFVSTREGIKITELNELFEKVGFPRRDPERLKVALENTHRLIWIRCLKQSRVARLGQLIGFARATSDGVFSATIWDVAVNPAWQRSGLGRAMMERLTRELVEDGIGTITLYAEPKVVGLYRKLGFVDDPEGIKAMAFHKKSQKAKSSWF